ncbi:hypothetical protein [Paraburkholderia fungorum]|uniref:hypothetical protein n=1 Tax=Paraburkholderia fungorum TaxID=134537 RepID=UPI0038B9B0F0
MNARAETIREKRSFSGAWDRLQLCLIPCRTFFAFPLPPRAPKTRPSETKSTEDGQQSLLE